MGEHPPRTPRTALAEARLAAGFSQKQLAGRLQVSLGSVKSWETGARTPHPTTRQSYAEVLGISPNELHRRLNPSAPIEVEGHAVPRRFTHYDSLVHAAKAVDQIETVAIPGMLQTEAYASAIERFGPLRLSDSELVERVDQRIARQAVLDRQMEPLELRIMMAEHILLNVLGNRRVMLDQCDHLLSMARRPNVTLHVLPADGRHTPARGGFQLITKHGDIEPFMVVDFGADGPRYLERPEQGAMFLDIYDYVRGIALSPTDSARRIDDIRESYR